VNRLRTLWRTVRDAHRLALEIPGEIMLGLEARRELADLHATGWPSVESLAGAWAASIMAEAQAAELLRRLFVDTPELVWRCTDPKTCACSVAQALRFLKARGLA